MEVGSFDLNISNQLSIDGLLPILQENQRQLLGLENMNIIVSQQVLDNRLASSVEEQTRKCDHKPGQFYGKMLVLLFGELVTI